MLGKKCLKLRIKLYQFRGWRYLPFAPGCAALTWVLILVDFGLVAAPSRCYPPRAEAVHRCSSAWGPAAMRSSTQWSKNRTSWQWLRVQIPLLPGLSMWLSGAREHLPPAFRFLAPRNLLCWYVYSPRFWLVILIDYKWKGRVLSSYSVKLHSL